MPHKRIVGLDIFRGWAIVMMIIFHFSYDLNYFAFIHIDITRDWFWVHFRYVIVSIFMLAVGMSLRIVHHPRLRSKSVLKRIIILGGASLIVTVVTYYQFPRAWVYFGILHLILLSSIVALPFVNHPRYALIASILIFVLSYYDLTYQPQLFEILKKPLHLPQYTVDLARFFPWFGAVLLGIYIASIQFFKTFFNLSIFSDSCRANKILAFLGRHALIIYLLHLPILFELVNLTRLLFHKNG